MAIESRPNEMLPEPQGDDKQASKESPKVVRESNLLNDWEGPISATQWLGPSPFGNFALHSTSSYGTSLGRSSGIKRETGCSQYYLQIRPPSWLTRRVWDILASNSSSGFKLCLRVYSIVPSDSRVFRSARMGDINGLLDLFNKKLASPFDRNEYGETLIHVYLPGIALLKC
jgi:hypothetical protein